MVNPALMNAMPAMTKHELDGHPEPAQSEAKDSGSAQHQADGHTSHHVRQENGLAYAAHQLKMALASEVRSGSLTELTSSTGSRPKVW